MSQSPGISSRVQGLQSVSTNETSGYAIAALVLGFAGILFLPAILAVILGPIAMKRSEDKGSTSYALGYAGTVLGMLSLAAWSVVLIFVVGVTFL